MREDKEIKLVLLPKKDNQTPSKEELVLEIAKFVNLLIEND